jgi:uncharacterized protein (TIGR02145 family)
VTNFNLFGAADYENAAAGTRWCLTDQRDGKIYRVVKMPDGRVWMAQNLNYQKVLTFNERSDMANGQAFTATSAGAGSYAIGSYWCPGVSEDKVSVKEGCDVWGGALYTWETAMSLDGKGTWVEGEGAASSYLTSIAASAGTVNFGRKTTGGSPEGGRGICPGGWHVPTEAEWGLLLDSMEDSGSVHSGTATGWLGVVAGKNAKATATCPTGTSAACATDSDPKWQYNEGTPGLDTWGFRVLPAGYRAVSFSDRGSYAYFWPSSDHSAYWGWLRVFKYDQSTVGRNLGNHHAQGCSVRCVRDVS